MKKYKPYIIGALLIVAGVAIGWVTKPSQEINNTISPEHNHSEVVKSDEIWTCSMHPQIRQNEPGICPICEMDLIPLDNSLDNDDPTVLRMSKEAAKLAQVETFVIGGQAQSNTNQSKSNSLISVDGTAEIDERTIKSQTAHLSGRIESMAINFEGQYVSKGQKIASIFSTELLAASQELITAAQYNDRVEGLKEASMQKLKNWKITDEQIEKILSDGKPMERISIYADHSGYILAKKLSQGDYVKPGQVIYSLGATDRLWLKFNVFESDLANVKIGNNITFTTPSIPNKEFNAQVSYIDPILNSFSRTATVRAEIKNTSKKLKPGMLLNGQINTTSERRKGSDNQQIIIPSSAVLWTGKRSVVYVQLPDTEVPSYEFREVELGTGSGKFINVSKGLNIGDEVVAQGAFAIDAAAQLNNNFSMMNRNVKLKKDDAQDIIPSYVEETPAAFKIQLDQSLVNYIQLKDALVKTDYDATKNEAKRFVKSLSNVDMALINGEAHMFWMEQLSALQTHGEKIEDAENIDEQRNQFDFLSKAMINTLRAFGTNGKTYYVQYCPMVNGNQGADWLSTEKQIRNPYFGDKMMKCGSIKLELK